MNNIADLNPYESALVAEPSFPTTTGPLKPLWLCCVLVAVALSAAGCFALTILVWSWRWGTGVYDFWEIPDITVYTSVIICFLSSLATVWFTIRGRKRYICYSLAIVSGLICFVYVIAPYQQYP